MQRCSDIHLTPNIDIDFYFISWNINIIILKHDGLIYNNIKQIVNTISEALADGAVWS
jgi:hypothetical protein